MNRRIMSWFGLVIAVCAWAGPVGADPVRVYFFRGGPYHDWQHNVPILKKVLEADGEFAVTMNDGDYKLMNRQGLEQFDVVAVYATSMPLAGVKGAEDALMEFVEAGGGLVGIHSASDCFGDSGRYWQMLGSRFKTHGEGYIRIAFDRPDHPILKKMTEFSTYDETYVQTYHPQFKPNSLMRLIYEGEDERSMGWAHQQGQGRVFYTALGHGAEAWNNPHFQQLITRALYWAAGKPVKDPPLWFQAHPAVVAMPQRGLACEVSRGKGIVNRCEVEGVVDLQKLYIRGQSLEFGQTMVGGRSGLALVSYLGQVLWQHPAADAVGYTSVQVYPETLVKVPVRLLVAEGASKRLLEYRFDPWSDPALQLERQIPLQTTANEPGEMVAIARRLENGHYLVCHPGEGAVKQYDTAGNVVQTIAAAGAYHAVRLGDGSTLISCGKKGKLIKVDGKGRTIWQLSSKDVPAAGLETVGQIQALVNGDIVVANRCQPSAGKYVLFRISGEKTIVWKIEGDEEFAGVSAFQLTDYDPRIRVRR